MKPRYRFSHRGGDRYYWYRTTPTDSRTEQISYGVDWFWNADPKCDICSLERSHVSHHDIRLYNHHSFVRKKEL
jgi:hypothetical protein